MEIENALLQSLDESSANVKKQHFPEQLYIFPLVRRPFFPGMAAPILIEPGPFYEILKQIAKSDHKCVGLLLTKSEEGDIYKKGFDDLYQVGVMARILRIIPMEQGGAQVILNMEKRIKIVEPLPSEGKTAQSQSRLYRRQSCPDR